MLDLSEFKKKYKPLYNIYIDQLKQYKNADVPANALSGFIVYIYMLRDAEILCGNNQNNRDTLIAAIVAYEKFSTCITEFYEVNSLGVIERKNKEKTDQEVQEEFNKQRLIYWNCFLKIVEHNLAGWIS